MTALASSHGKQFAASGRRRNFLPRRYTDAEGALTHLNNVGALLAEILTMADLTRVEVHGPATELEKLKKPHAHLNPAWFAIA